MLEFWRQSPTANAKPQNVYEESIFGRIKIKYFPRPLIQFLLYLFNSPVGEILKIGLLGGYISG